MTDMNFTVRALGEVVLRTGRLDEMRAFYRDVIGLEVMRVFEDGMTFFRLAPGFEGHTAVLALFPLDRGEGWQGHDRSVPPCTISRSAFPMPNVPPRWPNSRPTASNPGPPITNGSAGTPSMSRTPTATQSNSSAPRHRHDGPAPPGTRRRPRSASCASVRGGYRRDHCVVAREASGRGGLPASSAGPAMRSWRWGAATCTLRPAAARGAGRGRHVGIQTDDLPALHRRLAALGVPFRSGIREFGSWRYIMCEAPDGVLLELFQIDTDGICSRRISTRAIAWWCAGQEARGRGGLRWRVRRGPQCVHGGGARPLAPLRPAAARGAGRGRPSSQT